MLLGVFVSIWCLGAFAQGYPSGLSATQNSSIRPVADFFQEDAFIQAAGDAEAHADSRVGAGDGAGTRESAGAGDGAGAGGGAGVVLVESKPSNSSDRIAAGSDSSRRSVKLIRTVGKGKSVASGFAIDDGTCLLATGISFPVGVCVWPLLVFCIGFCCAGICGCATGTKKGEPGGFWGAVKSCGARKCNGFTAAGYVLCCLVWASVIAIVVFFSCISLRNRDGDTSERQWIKPCTPQRQYACYQVLYRPQNANSPVPGQPIG